MNLFFDAETTGTFPKDAITEIHFPSFPHIVSIAWKIGEKERHYKIFQEGRPIPEAASAIHGITTEMGNDRSATHLLSVVLDEFMIDLLEADKVIGHNIHFDIQIVKAEVFRLFGVESREGAAIKVGLDKSKRICTMRRGTGLISNKWPKLSELYLFLFNEQVKDAHNALGDIRATERIHYKLLEMGV